MPFVAEDEIVALTWDFRPYVDATGVTEEPSDDQVYAMNAALKDLVKGVTGNEVDPSDRQAVGRAFASLSQDQLRERDAEQIDAVLHVTNLSPTREQILALPFRVRRAYLKSLIKDINDPEAESAATNA